MQLTIWYAPTKKTYKKKAWTTGIKKMEIYYISFKCILILYSSCNPGYISALFRSFEFHWADAMTCQISRISICLTVVHSINGLETDRVHHHAVTSSVTLVIFTRVIYDAILFYFYKLKALSHIRYWKTRSFGRLNFQHL